MPGKAITTERTNATAGRSLARHFRRRTTDDRQRYGAGGFRAPLAGRADEHGGLTQGVRCGQAERPRPRQRMRGSVLGTSRLARAGPRTETDCLT